MWVVGMLLRPASLTLKRRTIVNTLPTRNKRNTLANLTSRSILTIFDVRAIRLARDEFSLAPIYIIMTSRGTEETRSGKNQVLVYCRRICFGMSTIMSFISTSRGERGGG